MLTNKEVMTLIGAKPFDVIAHGYTFDRDTVRIVFGDEMGQITLVRYEMKIPYDPFPAGTTTSYIFDANFFFHNIKRLYRDRTNPKLVELFKTFGRELPLV